MPSIPQPRIIKLPAGKRSRALLELLRQRPGTFYQLCERAGYDIERKGAEDGLRELFDGMHRAGAVNLAGLTYSLSRRARVAFEILAAVPLAGQATLPPFRREFRGAPVRIVRRPSSTRSAQP